MPEQLFQSIALIQNFDEGRLRLLLSWNRDQQVWRFVGGERLEHESFRETVVREVAWQLQLDRRTDFLVSHMAQLSMECLDTLPGEFEPRHVAVAFYPVHFYGEQARNQIAANRNLNWFDCDEICAGRTRHRQLIDPLIVHWINQWNVLNPWQ